MLIDKSLERFGYVWAAGGSANSVFRISMRDLIACIGTPVDVSK